MQDRQHQHDSHMQRLTTARHEPLTASRQSQGFVHGAPSSSRQRRQTTGLKPCIPTNNANLELQHQTATLNQELQCETTALATLNTKIRAFLTDLKPYIQLTTLT